MLGLLSPALQKTLSWVPAPAVVFLTVVWLFAWVDRKQDRTRKKRLADLIWGTARDGISFQADVAEFFDVVYGPRALSGVFLKRFLAIDTGLFIVLAALLYAFDFFSVFGDFYAAHGVTFAHAIWECLLNLFGAASVMPSEGAYVRVDSAILVALSYPAFIVTDFLALLKTRVLLRFVKSYPRPVFLAGALALDLALNVWVAGWLLDLIEFELHHLPSPSDIRDILLGANRYHRPGGSSLLGEDFLWDLNFIPVGMIAFVNSAWLWAYVLSFYITRVLTWALVFIARRLVSLDWLVPVRAHPASYMGYVAASFLAAITWLTLGGG